MRYYGGSKAKSSLFPAALVKRRQKQNAVTAFGHFLSWATEFAIALMVNVTFLAFNSNIDVDMVELFGFFYPCVNLVVFPFVQMMSSTVLREEARKFFKLAELRR